MELGLRGVTAAAQVSCPVAYKGKYVGEYFADIIAEDVLAIELKCVERLGNEHTPQRRNYLSACFRSNCLPSLEFSAAES